VSFAVAIEMHSCLLIDLIEIYGRIQKVVHVSEIVKDMLEGGCVNG
jgi:hypothetical protein